MGSHTICGQAQDILTLTNAVLVYSGLVMDDDLDNQSQQIVWDDPQVIDDKLEFSLIN